MLCFNVCDHFYCLGFQWQLLYVIWKWLLCFDLPQELISESFLYTLIALVFTNLSFVFLSSVWILVTTFSIYLSCYLSPHCLRGLIHNVLCQLLRSPSQYNLRRTIGLEAVFSPGLILCYCMAMLPSTDFISELIFSQSNVKGPWKVSHTWARRQCTTRPSSPMMLSMYDAFLMPVDTELPWALSKNIFK